MANPPWKRELPPEPPRNNKFLSSERPETERPQISPPEVPQHLKSQNTTSTNIRDRKKDNRATIYRPSRKFMFAVLLGIAGLLFVGFLATRLNSRGEVAGDTSSSPRPTTSTNSQAPAEVVTKPVPSGLWDSVARSVVYIEATGSRCSWSGSGSLVLDGSFVLTNQHVSGSGECSLQVFLTDSSETAPTRGLVASLVVFDETNDLAVLRVFGDDGKPFIDKSRTPLVINATQLALGAKLFTLGYPGAGGSTITFTSGDFAGMDDVDGVFYKTTAYMNSGVSGGAGLNERGELVGIPTAGKIDSVTNEKLGINLIRPISFAEDLLKQAEQKSPQKADVTASANGASSSKGSSSDNSTTKSAADPIFDTCAEAKSRGYGPYYSGQDYEYNFYNDRDRDGVVCE